VDERSLDSNTRVVRTKRPTLSTESPDRKPLTKGEVQWIALEIAIAVIAWILVGSVLAEDLLHVPEWVIDVIRFAGALAIALGIGWWRIIRHGPAGPPRNARRGPGAWLGSRPPEVSHGVPHVLAALGALVMSVVLLAQATDDDRALVWGVAFGLLAVIQFIRYLRSRDR
jgi:hypothetical protein